jgi:hypothetical protein
MAAGQGDTGINQWGSLTACDPPVLRTELHGSQFCQFERTVRQTGLLKLNLKNRIFRFLQKFSQDMNEVEIFICHFWNPWALRVSGISCCA